ncbi:MAG: type II toxin-antitoxin system VapC family toxin [Anaerolineales bacterium]|jgi:predicted nucleic acid-binding protein
MEIVVDTSVLIAVIANEPEKDSLIELTRGAGLVAPQSVHWEIANAFSAMLKRQRINLDQALRAIEIYRQIPIRLVDVELEDSLEIAQKQGIYAYDAFLLRSALKYKLPLLSLDRNMAIIARQMGIQILEVYHE